jgi:hypothetical protein
MNEPVPLSINDVSQLSDLLEQNKRFHNPNRVLWDMFSRPHGQDEFVWEQAALSGAVLQAMLGRSIKMSGLHDFVCLLTFKDHQYTLYKTRQLP